MRVRVIRDEVHCPDFLSLVTTVCIPFHCLTHMGTAGSDKASQCGCIPVGPWVALSWTVGGWIEHELLSVALRENKEEKSMDSFHVILYSSSLGEQREAALPFSQQIKSM